MAVFDRLLRPRHIATLGGKWAESVIHQCLKARYKGPIWPIHPNRDTLCGIKCFPSIEMLPEAPDCCFIGVNRHLTLQAVHKFSQMGAGGAICFASGFAEASQEIENGAELQAKLVDAANNMPILGPNCYGLINYLDNIPIWPDMHGGLQRETGVAIICQSSNIALNITMQARGLPIAYVVTTGNQATINYAHVATDLLDDSRVTAIGLYLEGFGNIREFEELAEKAHNKNVPIIAIKSGASDYARNLAVSHTCSIVGSNAASNALLDRLGIGHVSSVPVFVETLKLLHVDGPLKSNKITSLSCSGGEACLMADINIGHNLEFTPLTTQQEVKLRSILGPMVHLANPLDYHTYLWGDEEKLYELFFTMLEGESALTCLILDYPRVDRCNAESWEKTVHAFQRATKATKARTALVSSLQENLPEERCESLMNAGIIPVQGMSEMLAAADVAAFIGEKWKSGQPAKLALSNRSNGKPYISNDREVRNHLRKLGISLPKWNLAHSVDDLTSSAKQIGYPVVLKGRDIAHKTEHSAVRLNILNETQLMQVANKMHSPNGYLVEQYCGNAVAEIIISVIHERNIGYLLSIGSGGILTELHSNLVHLLLPCTKDEILGNIKTLKCWPLLNGYRGQSAGDIKSLVNTIMSICDFTLSGVNTIVEFEINPYLVMPDGGYAVDALLHQIVEE